MIWIPIADLAITFAALLALLWLVVPDAAPWVVLKTGFDRIRRQADLRWFMLAGLVVLGLDAVESQLDWWLTRWLGLDFTPLIYRWEGDLARSFQFTAAPWVIGLFAVFYEIIFSALMFGAPFLYAYRRQDRALKILVGAYMVEYLVVFPFYLFFPVLETGEGQVFAQRLTSQISPLLDRQIFGYFESSNNCFPSTHTALALIMALVAWDAGERRWGMVNLLSSGMVVFSTVYLGIHWVLDVVAGLVVGWGVYRGTKRWIA